MVIDVHTLIAVAVREELRAVLSRTSRRRPLTAASPDAWLAQITRKPVVVLRTGMGRDRAEKALLRVLEQVRPSQALLMGFCGGISEWAGATDLVVAEYVMDWPGFPGTTDADQPDAVYYPDKSLIEKARAVIIPSGGRIVVGGLLSVGRLVPTMAVKGYHGPRAARCRAIDMESGALVRVLNSANIPWLVVRGVTDTLDEDLPMPFDEFVTTSGEISRLRVLGIALREPALVPPLVRLGRQSYRAARHMADFAHAFVSAS